MDTSQTVSFFVTEAAKGYLKGLLAKGPGGSATKYLRVRVLGGGCAGFQYDFSLTEQREQGDLSVEGLVLIDAHSAPYLSGSTLDYVDNAMGAYVTVLNPRAQSHCGCKRSFSL